MEQINEPQQQTLREKIQNWSTTHAGDFPTEIRQIFARRTEEILKSDILSKVRREGDISPDFSLPTTGGNEISLKQQLASGPVILNFYRGTWCPYCNLEFESLLQTMPRFRNHRASVLAVSPQVLERYDDAGEADFLDLCDRGNNVARQFGLVYPLGDKIRSVYQQFGMRLEDLHQDPGYEVPIPATYVIDESLRIRYARAEADISERAEPEEILACLSGIYGSQ